MDITKHQGWIAYLSDGTTVYESDPIPNEPTPWQVLLKHCREDGLELTGLRLQWGNAMVMTMPRKKCDGYFHACEATYEGLLGTPVRKHKQGVGSVIGDQVFITWFEMKDYSLYVWADVRSLKDNRIHTTLQ